VVKINRHADSISGFTLLELLVVMVIIGMLAGLVMPRFFSQVGKSETKVATAQIVSLSSALVQYRLDTGNFPTSDEGLRALRVAPERAQGWYGPYLEQDVPNDPWQRPYVYQYPGEHSDFDLSTLGKDGRPGGERENIDIGNWSG